MSGIQLESILAEFGLHLDSTPREFAANKRAEGIGIGLIKAAANGGAPFGVQRLFNETGIKQSDWDGPEAAKVVHSIKTDDPRWN